MERDKNLYMYVYRMLLTSIYNGTYLFNEQLPSLQELCEKYDVGRNTIRNALSLLQEGGYVSLQKGTHARVTFDVNDLNTNIRYRQELLDNRDMTKDVYETLVMILPDITTACFAMRKNNCEELLEMLDHFTPEYLHNEFEMMELFYKIYRYVYDFMENPILNDLYFTLLSYAYQPVSPQLHPFSDLKKSMKAIRRMVRLAVKFGLSDRYTLAKNTVVLLCKAHAKTSLAYIDELCAGEKSEHSPHFIWVCCRNHEYLYAKVIQDMLWDIAAHRFNENEKLPSIEALADEYEVSQRTIRKALQTLREYQIVETINGSGSRIVLHRNNAYVRQLPEVRESLTSCMHALQLFSIITKAIMPMTLKSITKEERMNIADAMEQLPLYSIKPLLEYVYAHTNSCLYTIYTELFNTIRWNVLAVLFSDSSMHDEAQQKQLIEFVKSGDTDSICTSCVTILQKDYTMILDTLAK